MFVNIVQNIAKKSHFLLIFREEPGASFTKVGSNRINFNLPDKIKFSECSGLGLFVVQLQNLETATERALSLSP